ncbi:MAG: B12-binding domain-containing radical SAM protein [Candidatus Margulisbacteria bacterium]|nr:B12-binding domain-containing radical SAM protein [Candidatus Margulisiibacteriota bacterium]
MIKKVALINPGRDERFAVQEPLHLGFIASYLLKNGIEVRIIDELAGQNVKEELLMFRPDLAGITATTALAPDAYRIADLCRWLGIRTVMGGVHASILPDEALAHVDMVVKGEGENALLKIISEDLRTGVIEEEYIKNLDEIPIPARQLMDMEFYVQAKDRIPESYLYFVPPKTRVAAILTSRGCPYDCIFCHNSWKGMPFRFNSPERVIEEIDVLVSKYQIKALFFIEDNLFVHRSRLKKICELLLERKYELVWGGNARVDNVDPEILALAKRAGCRQITFGFESGSQKILDILRKRTTVEQIVKAIRMTREAGLLVNGTFIIGNPEETVEDIRATQRLIRENPIDSVGICIATPFPGTELWNIAERQGAISKDLKWSDFTYDRIPIWVNNKMAPQEILRYFDETVHLARSKSTIGVRQILVSYLFRPGKVMAQMVKAVRYPGKLMTFLRRIRLK